jgi:hypothetical protein
MVLGVVGTTKRLKTTMGLLCSEIPKFVLWQIKQVSLNHFVVTKYKMFDARNFDFEKESNTPPPHPHTTHAGIQMGVFFSFTFVAFLC